MGRIIFISPFKKTEITGGIKTTYNHAALLHELGFDATVFQPDGPPPWLSPRFRTLNSRALEVTEQDILVLPETLNGVVAQIAQTPTPARKVMFCQNQFYLFSLNITAEQYTKLGFTHVVVPSRVCKHALESVQKLPNVSVIPPFIDPEFSSRKKIMRIATAPGKYGGCAGVLAHAPLLRNMLGLKYPHLRAVPWDFVENLPAGEVVKIFGRAAIFLSLSKMEALGLTTLEAMASGCIVVGYRGIGGFEYATRRNGFWFSPEQLDEVVDALARVIEELGRDNARLRAVQKAAIATAAQFNRQETKRALGSFYGSLVAVRRRRPMPRSR